MVAEHMLAEHTVAPRPSGTEGRGLLVYFHIDELARDAVVAAGLKQELEARGGQVVYGNRLTTNYLLRRHNAFDAVILPSLLHFIDAYPNPEGLPGNVFILPTEAVGQATGTLRRIFGKYFGDDDVRCAPWHRAVRGFLLWGYAHLNPFREYHPEYLPRTRVIGHPRLSHQCNRRFDTPSRGKRTIGIVSRFNGLNPYDGRTPFETVLSNMRFGKERFTLYENSPNRDVEDQLYTEIIDVRVTFQLLMSLDYDRYDVAIRPHPREDRLGWERLLRKRRIQATLSPWDEPFGHWLQTVDAVVTPPSTSLYDIFFHGKRALVTSDVVPSRANHIFTESDDRNQILEGVCRPKSVAEIVERLDADDIPFDRRIIEQRLLEQVASDIASHSIDNLIATVADFLDGPPPAGTTGGTGGLWRFRTAAFAAEHLRALKWRVQNRVEQGSSFHLTAQRARWITGLAG